MLLLHYIPHSIDFSEIFIHSPNTNPQLFIIKLHRVIGKAFGEAEGLTWNMKCTNLPKTHWLFYIPLLGRKS